MKSIYLKIGGYKEKSLRSIWKVKKGKGIGYIFKNEPSVIYLGSKDIIYNCVEIKKKEFKLYKEVWNLLARDFLKPLILIKGKNHKQI